ncbi:pickpocket protein 19 [Camponotus floridanus]|uniref:pickpocket protein 19 n=1 Tax=Camponotus floridanus TaxID=104421 RepID=UPI000DC6AE94|nr:pickpocket protein 19 [Camponotus floridanus]
MGTRIGFFHLNLQSWNKTRRFLKIYSSEFDLAPKLCSRSATGSSQDIELFQIFQFPNKFSESSNLAVPSPNMKSGRRRLRKLTRIATLPVARIKMRGKKSQSKQLDTILQGLRYFCTQTTLHGLRYVVDPDLHMMERFLWLVLFVGSSISASHVIYSLALRFQAAPTSINIESLHYDNSKLPFPSVTLCPNVRVDWNRALELEPRIFSNDIDETSLEIFRKILGRLSVMTFGDFDEMDFLKNHNVRNLSGINITQVLYDVMPSCDQFLSACWWRNADRNCCEIFEVQKTEYGFCYSFNSEMAVTSLADPTESRPRKASSYGEWSGIKVTIHPGNITKPPDSNLIDGVIVIINEPHVWPNTGTMIPSSSLVSLSLKCISGYATHRVLELDRDKQPCLYDETGVYNQATCLSLCKRNYVIKYCGCNPSFLFPADLFNDHILYFGDEIPHDISRMICKCSPECVYYNYVTEFSNVPYNASDITLDVHYIGQTSFRYKMDVVFTQMDLLVYFGGIIGLFLGGSLLSVVEIVYYLIVGIYSFLHSRRRAEGRKTQPGSRRSSAMIVYSTTTVLPILDYSPLKQRARRIPIFANYGFAKSNLNRY